VELGDQGARVAGAEACRSGQLPGADQRTVSAEVGVDPCGVRALGQQFDTRSLPVVVAQRLTGAERLRVALILALAGAGSAPLVGSCARYSGLSTANEPSSQTGSPGGEVAH
jgi:hypothetical protein